MFTILLYSKIKGSDYVNENTLVMVNDVGGVSAKICHPQRGISGHFAKKKLKNSQKVKIVWRARWDLNPGSPAFSAETIGLRLRRPVS